MSALTPAAKEQIKSAGLTLRDYARSMGWRVEVAPWTWGENADGRWYGDACGCSDNRCIGHHHDEHDDCGCLPVLIERALVDRAERHHETPQPPCKTCGADVLDVEACPNFPEECLDCCGCGPSGGHE